MDLKGKIAVITGATGGIGREVVAHLDKEGFICLLLGTNEHELRILQDSLKTRGAIYPVDFTSLKDVLDTLHKINSDFQRIDLLVNLAGIGIYKPIEEVSTKDWEDSFSINVTATYFVIQKLLDKLSKSSLALVISAGSGMGVLPTAGRSVYCATKFALRGMILSLAEEFKRIKPEFILMTLGSVLTSFGPMSLEEKKEEELNGKAYLTAESVAKKIIEVIKTEKRESEYTLYPSDYAPKKV